jgi:hypothetical protein
MSEGMLMTPLSRGYHFEASNCKPFGRHPKEARRDYAALILERVWCVLNERKPRSMAPDVPCMTP